MNKINYGLLNPNQSAIQKTESLALQEDIIAYGSEKDEDEE